METPKFTLSITRTLLQRLAMKLKLKMNADAINGIMGDGQRNLQYRSKTYAKYKANAMRRFTREKSSKNPVRVKGKRTASDIQHKSAITKGTAKLKGFAARSIHTDVSKVNLHLTGELYKSATIAIRENGFSIGYSQEFPKKVYGLQAYGYNPIGITQENQDMIVKEIRESFDKQVQSQFNRKLSKDLNI
jgi:hypothetical protein